MFTSSEISGGEQGELGSRSKRSNISVKILLDWNAKDGLDSSVHFLIADTGVGRYSGRGWRTVREVGRSLGQLVLLGGLISGRSGSSGYGPMSHWLSSKSVDKQFMRWKNVRKMSTDERTGVILLQDHNGTEMRICCSPGTYEPAVRLIKEKTGNIS